ncbi:MAG: hypothetical protein ACKVPX_02520 [Myxococcaceae bacterium]
MKSNPAGRPGPRALTGYRFSLKYLTADHERVAEPDEGALLKTFPGQRTLANLAGMVEP